MSSSNRNLKNMSEGPILPVLLSFAGPMIVSFLFQDLYSLADMTIAGYTLGDTALAAVSATSGITTFINATSRGFNIGNAISVSNAFGEKNLEKTRKSLAAMAVLCLSLSLLLTLLLACFIRPLILLVNTPADLQEAAWQYIIVIILGLTCSMVYDYYACAFRALGNSRLPLYFLICCSLLNILLDYLFMAVLHLGVAGASLATVLSQLISAVLSGICFHRLYPELRFTGKDFSGLSSLIRETAPLGISGSLTNSVYAVGTVAISWAVNSLGTDTMVAFAAYNKLRMFTIIPSISIANTIATFAAQNYGAGKYRRVTKGILAALAFSLCANLLTFGISFAFGRELTRLITATTSAAVVEESYAMLLISSGFIWAQTAVMCFRMSIQGFRRKLLPILGTLIELVVRCAFAFLVTPAIGFTGIAWAEPASWLISGAAMTVSYFLVLRKEIRQTERKKT